MKKNELIRKLQKIEGNLEIRVDFDDNGWFELEKVSVLTDDDEGGCLFINVKTSNEM